MKCAPKSGQLKQLLRDLFGLLLMPLLLVLAWGEIPQTRVHALSIVDILNEFADLSVSIGEVLVFSQRYFLLA